GLRAPLPATTTIRATKSDSTRPATTPRAVLMRGVMEPVAAGCVPVSVHLVTQSHRCGSRRRLDWPHEIRARRARRPRDLRARAGAGAEGLLAAGARRAARADRPAARRRGVAGA